MAFYLHLVLQSSSAGQSTLSSSGMGRKIRSWNSTTATAVVKAETIQRDSSPLTVATKQDWFDHLQRTCKAAHRKVGMHGSYGTVPHTAGCLLFHTDIKEIKITYF